MMRTVGVILGLVLLSGCAAPGPSLGTRIGSTTKDLNDCIALDYLHETPKTDEIDCYDAYDIAHGETPTPHLQFNYDREIIGQVRDINGNVVGEISHDHNTGITTYDEEYHP